MIGDHNLTPWEKLAILFLAGALVSFSLLLVVCFVCPTCVFFKVCCNHQDEEKSKRGFRAKRQFARRWEEAGNRLHYDHYSTASDCDVSEGGDWIPKWKKKPDKLRSKSLETLSAVSSSDNDSAKLSWKSSLLFSPKVVRAGKHAPSTSSELSKASEVPATKSSLVSGSTSSQQKLVGHRTTDSTYGSLASSSGRTSPSNMSILSSTFSHLSLALGGSGGSSKKETQVPPMVLRLTLKVEKKEDNALLLINLLNINDIPRRSYCFSRDTFATITLVREKSSLLSTSRKSRQNVMLEHRTNVVKRNLNPNFNYSCIAPDIDTEDLKSYRVKVVVFDQDRNTTKVSKIGSATIPLKTVKSALVNEEGNVLEFSLCAKLTPKEDIGCLTFGLSYLPTAQRLSFSISKATNLRFENVVSNIQAFEPFVQILQINPSGKVLKKKKTPVVCGSRDPIFNETLNFDLAPNHVEFMSFIVMLGTKQSSFDNEKSQNCGSGSGGSGVQAIDKCLGYISIGKSVTGDKERAQWFSVMTSPRKVFTATFKLE